MKSDEQGFLIGENLPTDELAALLPAIHHEIELIADRTYSTIHSDGWRGQDGLVDRGHKKHSRVNHGQHEFSGGDCPINGI